MIVARKPFSRAARILAVVLAAVCLAAGGLGIVLGLTRRHVMLTVSAAAILALGGLYASAAWRGRPW